MSALDRAALAVEIFELDLLILTAEQHEILDLGRQALERRFDVEFGVAGERLDQLKIIGIAPVPPSHGTAGERQVWIRDHFLGIEKFLGAEAVAARTGTDRAVEREQAGFELGQRIIANRAGEFVREHELCALRVIHVGDSRHPSPKPQRGFERLGETLTDIRAHPEAIDDRLDRMFAAYIEFRCLVQLDHLAVDARSHEATGPQLLDELCVLTLALRDRGREQHHGGTLGMLENGIDHLTHRLRRQIDVMVGAPGRPGARVQEPQVVVHFSHGTYRRARIVRSRFLLDGDRRREPFDRVDVGLFHHGQELTCVRGE